MMFNGGYDGWDGGDWSGYGDFGYDDGASGYVDASPAIVTAPVAQIAPAEATRPVTVINPPTTGTALSFAIGGQTYTLPAGESRDIDTTSGSVIEFDRGTGDTAQYTLSDGPYIFGATSSGWELYRGILTSAVPAPTPRLPWNRIAAH